MPVPDQHDDQVDSEDGDPGDQGGHDQSLAPLDDAGHPDDGHDDQRQDDPGADLRTDTTDRRRVWTCFSQERSTFHHHHLERTGLESAFAHRGGRAPVSFR